MHTDKLMPPGFQPREIELLSFVIALRTLPLCELLPVIIGRPGHKFLRAMVDVVIEERESFFDNAELLLQLRSRRGRVSTNSDVALPISYVSHVEIGIGKFQLEILERGLVLLQNVLKNGALGDDRDVLC